MENSLSLRLLDPVEDLELYRVSYNWRPTPKRHTQSDRLPFESYIDTDPTHLTIGLFNGELIAVYFFCEWKPACFDAHFTSKRGVSREVLLQGAKEVLGLVLTNGGSEVSALIRTTNRPLRQFVTELGMECVGYVFFTCLTDLESCNFYAPPSRNQRQRVYVKYVKMKEDTPIGNVRQEAGLYTNRVGPSLDSYS